MSDLTQKLMDTDGYVSPRLLPDAFHATVKKVAELTGLAVEAVSKKTRARSKRSQQRLHDMIMVLNRVTPWSGTVFQAYAWYRSEPIPSLGDVTAQTLVGHGEAGAVMRHLERIAEGGYARCIDVFRVWFIGHTSRTGRSRPIQVKAPCAGEDDSTKSVYRPCIRPYRKLQHLPSTTRNFRIVRSL